MEEIALDRARAYTVSTLDPVTGGAHCSIGGTPHDFVVTSTLSSQAPPAVGRALGAQLASQLKIEDPPISPRAVSYVSLGDGSVNNAHFLAALNLAEYASHRGFKCPVLFGITDNQISISLRGYDWLPKFVEQRIGMKLFRADGTDIVDSFRAATEATEYVRKKRKPACAVFSNLPRRYGHAATDRQQAYLTRSEIENARNHDPLSKMCAHAVRSGALTFSQLETRFSELKDIVERAFDQASEEPKITSRDEIVKRVSQPIRAVTRETSSSDDSDEKPEVMRKHMTRLMHEVMEQTSDVVYLGEVRNSLITRKRITLEHTEKRTGCKTRWILSCDGQSL